jgi:hypothetical protein
MKARLKLNFSFHISHFFLFHSLTFVHVEAFSKASRKMKISYTKIELKLDKDQFFVSCMVDIEKERGMEWNFIKVLRFR